MAFVKPQIESESTPLMTAFDRVRMARDPERPYSLDIVNSIFTDFVEVHGDRRYADDPALVCGFARLDALEVAVIGQQKGRDTNQRRFRNFAMPKPEGYRKALRLMGLAEKFGRPIITFVDTPGAYPGIDAEERGQAEAIAVNLREMAGFKVPIIAVIVGEGGSGGALAIGIADRVIMLENAIYSVISPEGCAAILWKDASKADLAANALKLTAKDLKGFQIIDEVIPEPAVWEIADNEDKKPNFNSIAESLKQSLIRSLQELAKVEPSRLTTDRFRKFRMMGRWA
ncbi:MAG TPA: acetyl-CoA carboxylase carboxyltransferase subunit alpha [Pyrinomonadaceae bacterium]|nr:acetyl-CoA carboxylase carboxyltransferase subunit alpha [Pyrinomonadaceae bacterium]